MIWYAGHLGARRCAAMLALAITGATMPLQAQPAADQAAPAPAAPVPVTLMAVLDSVAGRYPVVLAAQARVRAAQGSRRTAGLLGNPILSYLDNQASNRTVTGPVVDRERSMSVTLPLEWLYQRGARVQRADASVQAATQDAVATRRRAMLDATRVFYRAALAQVGVGTARDLLAWLTNLVAYNRARAQQGVTAQVDLLRSEIERDRAAGDVALQEAEFVRARAELTAFLGVSPATAGQLSIAAGKRPLTLSGALVAAAGSPVTPDAVGEAMLEPRTGIRRADVRAARQRVTAASAGISAERSMLFRQLGATFGTRQVGATYTVFAGLSVPVPLFDLNRGEIARAVAERDAASYDLTALEQSVNAELRGAYEAARLLTDRTTAIASDTAGYLARADDVRRIALGAYREGAVPLLQVIDAARAWGDARMSYYRVLYAQQQSIAALVYAEGGDLLTTLPALATPSPPSGPRP